MFEVFLDGKPTGEPSPVGPQGLPLEDGRDHGLRLYWDMAGTCPRVMPVPGLTVVQDGSRAVAYGKAWTVDVFPAAVFEESSLNVIRSFRPEAVRTLDLARANRRLAWPTKALLQGADTGLALSFQLRLCQRVGARPWLNVPLSYGDQHHERRLRDWLTMIHSFGTVPVLELGNELWNSDFPARTWLSSQGRLPEVVAGQIELMAQAADEVLGRSGSLGARRWFLFVGGQLADPGYLDQVLHYLPRTPDMAGPALYIGPTREDQAEWAESSLVPSQAELEASCERRIGEAFYLLGRHATVARDHHVPFLSCYEVGQSMNAGHHPWRQAAAQAQREEWMGDLYRSMRTTLETHGVELACWYSLMTDQDPPAPTAPFGLLEGVGLPELPKARAARGG